MKTKEEVICFKNEDHFAKFRDLFGSSMTYGVRRRRPKIGSDPDPITRHDTLNHIAFSEAGNVSDNKDNPPVRVPPSNRGGLDLVYNLSTGDGSLRDRYRKSGRTEVGLLENEEGSTEEEPIGVDAIFVGEYFDSADGCTTFKVVSIGPSRVMAEDINAIHTLTEFDVTFVRVAIKEKQG
jgi:hypothetical protein